MEGSFFEALRHLILWDSTYFYNISSTFEHIISCLPCLIPIFFADDFACAFADPASHLINSWNHSIEHISSNFHSSSCPWFDLIVVWVLL